MPVRPRPFSLNRKTGIIYVFLCKGVERWHLLAILIDGFALTPVFPRDLPIMNGTQEEHKLSKLDAMSYRLDVSHSCRVRRDPDCEDARTGVSQMSTLTVTLTESPKKLPPPEALKFGTVSLHLCDPVYVF